jgi:hypothetical protein
MKKLVVLSLICVFAAGAMADLSNGLVGWWKMDGPTDPENARIVKDYSGFGNDGTMGSSDQWIAGGGIDFDRGFWGASGITFTCNGADLIADMGLTSQVTISFSATWDEWQDRGNYTYDGRTSGGQRILSSECPTGSHMLDHYGDQSTWTWEAFNDQDSRFIFKHVDQSKTWGDMVLFTTTINLDTGDYKLYIDGQLKTSSTGNTGSFADLATFFIGRDPDTYACMGGSMEDFRIWNRELSSTEVASIIPEPTTIALLGLGGLALIRRKK